MLTLITAVMLYRARNLLRARRSLAWLAGCFAIVLFASLAFGLDEGPVVEEILVEPPAALEADMPPAALEAADAMFRASGYAQAAREYAKLSLRFGASDLLYGRRFIAQIMSHDFEQALVIRASARLTGNKISRESLPGKSLSGLNLSVEEVEPMTELLASQAMLDVRDADRLEMMATWLRLAGDVKRSELFQDRVRELRQAEADAALSGLSLVEPL